MELAEFRASVDAWLDEHADALSPRDPVGSRLEEHVAQINKVKRLTYDADWMRFGWPERVGGLGGSPLLRAYLAEALTARDLVEPGIYSLTEVLAPTIIDYAPEELAATMVPRLLRGDETWCQGFSEPETGSNLASLSCRATRTDGAWIVNGQKLWTSLAQYAQRCVLLTRTGTAQSAHKGITALFVDMDSSGITVRPLQTIHGVEEFCEVFFDEVLVPLDRTLGQVDHGWAVAMDILPFERSTALWQKCAFLRRRLEQLIAIAAQGALDPTDVGDAFAQLFSLRARSRATLHRLASGERLGPETSIDKILVATTEQTVFDLVARGLSSEILLGDDSSAKGWREEFLFSRAATIYGGTSEIQRNIVARRLLDLGAES